MIEPFGFASTIPMSLATLTRNTLASVCAPSSANLKLPLHKNLQRFDNNWNIYKNSRGSRYIQLPSSFRLMWTVNLLFNLIWSIFIGLLKKTIYFSKPLSDRIRIQYIKKSRNYKSIIEHLIYILSIIIVCLPSKKYITSQIMYRKKQKNVWNLSFTRNFILLRDIIKKILYAGEHYSMRALKHVEHYFLINDAFKYNKRIWKIKKVEIIFN